MSRRGARLYHTIGNRDRNEKPIIDRLKASGFSVTPLQGRGVPDLLVSKWRHCWLIEIKQPKATYTPAQLAWRDAWKGPAVATLRSVDDVGLWVLDPDSFAQEPSNAAGGASQT